MWLTATFGAVTHHAKSFATPRLRLLDFFSFLRILQEIFFNQKHMLNIFFGICTTPPSKIKWSTPYMQVSTFDLPLFPGYQGRENVSALMLPEQVDSFLNKFNSVAGILGFLEWPLCNFRWCLPEKHVVRGYVATVIWSFGTLPIGCWLKGFATSRNTVFNSNGVRSWPMAFLRAFFHV